MAITNANVTAHAGTGWGSVFDAINKAQQGQGQGADFTARVQDLNDAGLGTQLRTSARSPFGHLMNFNDRAYATGWNIPWSSNFQAPVSGQAGPGGAIAGGGQGATNDNPFDINAPGAGLWSAGYNPNDAGNVEKLYWQLAMSKDAVKKPELARFYGQPAGTQFSQNDLQDFLNAADWYYRDQARQVDKQNKFGDSLVGKLVLGGLTALSGGTFGPVVGAAMGAGLGTASSNPYGPLLGAASGGLAGVQGFGGGIFSPSETGLTAAQQAAVKGAGAGLGVLGYSSGGGGSGGVSDTQKSTATPNPLLAALPFLAPSTTSTPTQTTQSVSLPAATTQGSTSYSIPGLLNLAQDEEPTPSAPGMEPQQSVTKLLKLRGARNVKADRPNWQQYQLQSPLQKQSKSYAEKTADALRRRSA